MSKSRQADPDHENTDFRTDSNDSEEEEEIDSAQFLTDPKDIQEVLKQFHDSPLGGHRGAVNTYYRVRRQFKWSGMQRDLKQYVKTCPLCQKNKGGGVEKLPMIITDTAEKPFEKVFMDIVGPVGTSVRGNNYILTFQDSFSKD